MFANVRPLRRPACWAALRLAPTYKSLLLLHAVLAEAIEAPRIRQVQARDLAAAQHHRPGPAQLVGQLQHAGRAGQALLVTDGEALGDVLAEVDHLLAAQPGLAA